MIIKNGFGYLRPTKAENVSAISTRNIFSSSNKEHTEKGFLTEVIGHKMIDFSDVEKSLQCMSTGEILRGALVYQFCSYKFLVKHSMKLFDYGKKFMNKELFEKLMKNTFYGHFATCDAPSEILKRSNDLWKNGIGSSLAYSVEDDMAAHLDGDNYEEIFKETMRCISLAAACNGETSVAVKVTAFLPPNALLAFNRLLKRADQSDRFCSEAFDNQLQEDMLKSSDLDDEERNEINLMMERMKRLADHARQLGVRLIVDAEHTYFQTAIRYVALLLMKNFNKESSVVVNTYQNYLKMTRADLHSDLVLSKNEDFYLGVKMVRGAYLDHERKRAKDLNYEDPIQPTYEDTNRNYNENVLTLLEDMQENSKVSLIIASHNEETVHFALYRLAQLNLDTRKSDVTFAQLMGMCDHITYSLSRENHKVYKYLPYGPVTEVLPYLHRRAQENQAVLGGRAENERKMYWKELKRRILHD